MIRLGIVGLGKMGTYHTRVASELPSCTITAIADTKEPNTNSLPAGLADCFTHDITTSFNHIDALIIATPTPTHFDIAQKALNAGKHVLIEKPITSTLTQATELFRLAKEQNCALQVGFVERFNPAYLMQKVFLSEPPRYIHAVRSGPFHPRVQHDSVIIDLMIHDLDAILFHTKNTPTLIHANGSSLVSSEIDIACAQLQFPHGCIAQIAAHRNAIVGTRKTYLESPDYSLECNYGTRELIRRTKENPFESFSAPHDANPLKEQLHHFLTHLSHGFNALMARHDYHVLSIALMIQNQIASQK